MNEKEQIMQAICYFIEQVLVNNNPDAAMQVVSDDVLGVGMSEQGTVSCKEEVLSVLNAQKPKAGAVYSVCYPKADIRYYPPCFASACVVYELSCTIGRKTTKNAFIQTVSAKKENGKWKLCLLQAVPIQLTRDSIDVYPLEFAEKTLAQLKADLQSATFDLMNQSISGGILGCYLNNSENCYPLYFINDSMLSYLDYTREEFESRFKKNVWEVIYKPDRPTLYNAISHAAQDSKPFQIRHRIVKKDGSILWMVLRAQPGADENEKPVIIGVFVDVTEMITLQEQLRVKADALKISEERFRIALEKTSNIIFDYDITSGNIVHASVPTQSMDFVTNIKEMKKGLVIGGEIADEDLHTLQDIFQLVQKGQGHCSCIVKAHLFTGKVCWKRITLNGITDKSGKTVRAIGMIEDITRQKEAELAYAREEQYRRAMLANTMASYVINFTRNQFESCRIDHPFCVSVVAGEPYDAFIEGVARERYSTKDRRAFLNTFSKSRVLEQFDLGKKDFSLQYRVLTPDGQEMWLQTAMRLVVDSISNDVKGFMYVTDIDKKKREELELTRKSEQDSMTGVYNKGAVTAHIKEKLVTYEGIQSGVFLMLDVDKFKAVNDTYGHPFGDKVLIEVANVLKENSRKSDLIGRLGGDEFCIFLCGISSKSQVERIAQAICEGVERIATPHSAVGISCSIGITMCQGKAKSFDRIYHEADTALYYIKNNGRNSHAFFEGVSEQ